MSVAIAQLSLVKDRFVCGLGVISQSSEIIQ